MRIGIEGKVLTLTIGGVGRCAINLVRAVLAQAADAYPKMEFVIYTAPQTDPKALDGVEARICARFKHVKSSLLRASLLLPAGMVLEQLDIFHGLDQAGIPFFGRRGNYVVTLHDVIGLVLPWAVPLRRRIVLRAAFSCIRRQADAVIVPSEAVREDVVRYLKMDRGRIIVIPWGCETRFQPSTNPDGLERIRRRYKLPDQYILSLGTLEPRKNMTTLLHAFSLLCAEQPASDFRLVIAGEKGWGYESLFATVEALGLHRHIIFTGFVAEEDLPDLYRGALLFIYPSLYEGFGLPILEAMACGTPVIASHTSSMPEVAGDAAVLVDPTRPEALASAMASVLGNKEQREDLRGKGIARAGGFSWDSVARKTLDVYAAFGH